METTNGVFENRHCPAIFVDRGREAELRAGLPAPYLRPHSRTKNNGAPEEIRTPDPQIRSLVLYPAELRVRFEGRNLFRSPPQRQEQPVPARDIVAAHPQFPASPGGNVQISPPSGIVVPCPLPPCWLRLAGRPPGAIVAGGWAPKLYFRSHGGRAAAPGSGEHDEGNSSKAGAQKGPVLGFCVDGGP